MLIMSELHITVCSCFSVSIFILTFTIFALALEVCSILEGRTVVFVTTDIVNHLRARLLSVMLDLMEVSNDRTWHSSIHAC